MPSKKHKVLFVDDDEVMRIYFRDVFWIHGFAEKYDITVVENVEKAEEIINSPKTMPDIVFLDLAGTMIVDGKSVTTVEAGFSLLKKIKENPATQHIKVVVFSGFGQKEYEDKAHALGAEGYLVKGETMPEELIKYIGTIKK